MEVWNRLDQDWRDILEEFNFETISFEDLKIEMNKVMEVNMVRRVEVLSTTQQPNELLKDLAK